MTTTARFESHPAALQKVLDRAARRIVTSRASETLVYAKEGAPVGSGAAKRSLGYTVAGTSYQDIVGRVGGNDPAVLFAEQGTRPHIIRARGRVMKFPGTNGFSGKTIYTAVVHHPGSKGTHFLRNALRKAIGRRG